jgi:hypothetical protein
MSASQIGYRCNACGHQWTAQAHKCPSCASTNVGRLFGMNLEGSITPAGTLEAVADNPRGGSEFIQYLSPSGSRPWRAHSLSRSRSVAATGALAHPPSARSRSP